MPRPRFCRNPACPNAHSPPPNWLARAGSYETIAHGTVQRFVCKHCGKGMGMQTESMHYYAKRRLDLAEILSRVRGGSSLRDIGRELGCSRMAIANAVVRLGRQAMANHVELLTGLDLPGELVFDGLVSAVTSHDFPSQIQTLVDRSVEMVLAMTHYVGERGGRRTRRQQKRIERKRTIWRPTPGALAESIRLLVKELPRFAGPHPITIDTDENPLYASVMADDAALGWYRQAQMLKIEQTPSTSPRTIGNPLFPVNYVDRMIRHRVKEHTRESIAIGRNATMQMMRMWIFAWDHNVRQPYRVNDLACSCRAIEAGVSEGDLRRLTREFYTRRRAVRGKRIPESIRRVWLSQLETP
ncbi:MAG: hypothetical protein ACOCZB_03080, partial [Spirochaetota bacterium]